MLYNVNCSIIVLTNTAIDVNLPKLLRLLNHETTNLFVLRFIGDDDECSGVLCPTNTKS